MSDPASPFPPIRTTIRDVVSSLGFCPSAEGISKPWIDPAGVVTIEYFRWPPDVFAMSAYVLRESGAYVQASRSHDYSKSPYGDFSLKAWRDRVNAAAEEWKQIDGFTDNPPDRVLELLQMIGTRASSDQRLCELSAPDEDNFEWLPYLELMCIADSACRGAGLEVGIPSSSSASGSMVISKIAIRCADILIKQDEARSLAGSGPRAPGFMPTTLCRIVDPSRAVVLPKMRTSQRGATIRSFSIHLGLLTGTDVEPLWHSTPTKLLHAPHRGRNQANLPNTPHNLIKNAGPYNVLVLPWPLKVSPIQFKPSDSQLSCLGDRPSGSDRFFGFEHSDPAPADIDAIINELVIAAKQVVGTLHGLVLPEMALSEERFNAVFPSRDKLPHDLEFLACGVYRPPTSKAKLARNYAVVRRRQGVDKHGSAIVHEIEQDKHHRWAVDSGQLTAYRIGSSLNPQDVWWEGTELTRRMIHFFALDTITAFTVLICEDLARPDPVADAVRVVGPNLVIALLMDGPQLSTRWGARYATVLSDDPGSSVLTVSSLGMVNLSRVRERSHESSRVIALWREPGGAPIEIALPAEHHGLLLSMYVQGGEEKTIDGRDDEGIAATVKLAGVFPLASPKAKSLGY